MSLCCQTMKECVCCLYMCSYKCVACVCMCMCVQVCVCVCVCLCGVCVFVWCVVCVCISSLQQPTSVRPQLLILQTQRSTGFSTQQCFIQSNQKAYNTPYHPLYSLLTINSLFKMGSDLCLFTTSMLAAPSLLMARLL